VSGYDEAIMEKYLEGEDIGFDELKASMRPGAAVLMSGFFPSDFDQVNAKAAGLGWNWHSSMDREGWACILWEKSEN
ncbi:MAG: hypothetical protein P8K81_06985, partial [Flavobacteriales bacterium]|nr:hypothetical protein [Flavobacteriales bacterium]